VNNTGHRPVPPEIREQIETLFRTDSVEWMLDCLIERAQEAWRTSPQGDTATRERLYWKVQAIEDLKSEIKRICTNDAVEAFNGALRRQKNWSTI
jgi:hypothetical protein